MGGGKNLLMKTYIKSFLLLVSCVAVSVISCQNEPLSATQEPVGSESVTGGLSAVRDQLSAMKSSVSDVRAVQDGIDMYVEEVAAITEQMLDDMKAIGVKSSGADAALAAMKAVLEEEKAVFAAEAEAIEKIVASVKEDADWEKTALSTLVRSKSLAEAAGSLEYRIGALGEDPSMTVTVKSLRDAYDKCLKGRMDALAEGVAAWLGEPFGTYYALAVDGAKMGCEAEALFGRLEGQKLSIERLGAGTDAEEITTSVAGNTETASEISAHLTSMISELDEGYRTAVEYAVAHEGDVDAAALAEVNETASAGLMSVSTSLTDLTGRIATCESEIADLKASLETMEGTLEEMLSLIQSVTFVSDYSTEAASAYYTLETSSTNATYGIPDRTPTGTIKLNWLVRPASAAAALASEDIWNTGLKVIGYYAPKIRLSSVSASDMIDFKITGVSANAESGLVTVSVDNTLSEAFYFKKTGAKLALSVSTGKTDFTTRFVEILPKDESTRIYVDGITLSETEVELDNGEDVTITAKVSPSDATNGTVSWTSSDESIVKVSGGKILAVGVGTATVTAVTNGIDEWGLKLSASCKVTVNEAVRMSGPTYIEVGKTAQMFLDYPASIIVDSKTWWTSASDYATVDQNGVVTAVKYGYNETIGNVTYSDEYTPVTIYCKINETTVSHELKIVAVQPKGVSISGLADDDNVLDLKIDESFTFSSTILPETVESGQWRVTYRNDSNLTGIADVDFNTGKLTVNSTGTTYVYVDVLSVEGSNYWAPDCSLRRTVTVNVEPYYVETLSLPATFTMNPDQKATLSATFTSDVEGKLPTKMGLKWTSSDPTIVSIHETTGEMTSEAIGSVTITATTSDALAVPEGAEPKSASCIVTVKAPTNPIAIGDYYYSDGTWSTALDASKTVIGVVFATTNAVASDTKLLSDYSNCTNGLVVSVNEYNSVMGYISYSSAYSFMTGVGGDWGNTTLANGYSNTVTLAQYSANNSYVDGYSSYYAQLFRNDSNGVPYQHTKKVTPPASASAWYIPSFYEMQQLAANMSKVNDSLSAVGGDSISSGAYWLSTLYQQNKNMYTYTFNMSSAGWGTYIGTPYSSKYPVRVILAF